MQVTSPSLTSLPALSDTRLFLSLCLFPFSYVSGTRTPHTKWLLENTRVTSPNDNDDTPGVRFLESWVPMRSDPIPKASGRQKQAHFSPIRQQKNS
mmetsp:Transcript_2414/g.4676  ORF Transcript_2414/g.4676 Transcript_2414/m.4676 type:complete len:96 (+) Transcript_2414:54-341(+)